MKVTVNGREKTLKEGATLKQAIAGETYVDGSVNIKSEDSPIKSADIYNMSGMKMAATSFAHGGNKFVSINVASLPKGIYLVSTTTEDGDECHIKFVIK